MSWLVIITIFLADGETRVIEGQRFESRKACEKAITVTVLELDAPEGAIANATCLQVGRA